MSSKKVKKAKAHAKEELDERTLNSMIQNVRKRWHDLALTQTQASLDGGLEPQYFTAFENGLRRNPTLVTLNKMAKGLKTTMAALVTMPGSS